MGGRAVNIGGVEEIPIIEVARLVKRLTKSNSKMVFTDLPENDPLKRKPDIELAKKCLGWRPSITLETGLKRTIEYFAAVV